jgi:hypothetical protein
MYNISIYIIYIHIGEEAGTPPESELIDDVVDRRGPG